MDSSLQLFQIGAHRLHLISDDDNWSYDDSSVAKAEEFLYSNRKATVNSQWLRGSREMKWGGLLASVGEKRADQMLQTLRGIVGLPQPIIGYLYIDHKHNYGCNCNQCCENRLVFFSAIGEVTKVRPKSNGTSGIPELDISVALHSHWQQLDRYLWHFDGMESTMLGQVSPNTDYLSVYEASPWPTPERVINYCCGAWAYQDYTERSFKFDPNYWAARFSDTCGNPEYQGGKAASWQTGNIPISLYIDQGVYGGDTIATYAFRNLPTYDSIYININYRRGLNQQSEQTRLDLGDIDSAINDAGQGNLEGSDILIIGETILERRNGTSYPRAIILRDGEILPNVFVPIAASPHYAPGKVGGGHSQISIIVPSGVESAYSFLYQRV